MKEFIEETTTERAVRRVESCTYTMISIIDELVDPENVEDRADLLVAIEELYEVAMSLVDDVRGIAWQYTLTPAEISAQEEDNDW